jgi:hypothetical protein
MAVMARREMARVVESMLAVDIDEEESRVVEVNVEDMMEVDIDKEESKSVEVNVEDRIKLIE